MDIQNKITEYKSLDEKELSASHRKCIILSEIKTDLLEKYGSEQVKGYKKEIGAAIQVASLKASQFRRDVQIGNYLIQNRDNPELNKLNKTDIYKQFICTPKPKVDKPKEKTLDYKTEYECLAEAFIAIRKIVPEKAWIKVCNDAGVDPNIIK